LVGRLYSDTFQESFLMFVSIVSVILICNSRGCYDGRWDGGKSASL
jgi:hypothetical protein